MTVWRNYDIQKWMCEEMHIIDFLLQIFRPLVDRPLTCKLIFVPYCSLFWALSDWHVMWSTTVFVISEIDYTTILVVWVIIWMSQTKHKSVD